MKSRKPQSITTDTHLSHSHVFNSQLNYANPNLQSSMMANIQQSQSKELDYLRNKNRHLEERIRRMQSQRIQLEASKANLFSVNQKYAEVVNQYHRNRAEIYSPGTRGLLHELERDHRNLVKHCQAMQGQIKNYAYEVEKYHAMLDQLKQVNHTSVKELAIEVKEVAKDNKQLRKQNNKISFQLQKAQLECAKLQQAYKSQSALAQQRGKQIQIMSCQLNTFKQDKIDSSNAYESQIFQLAHKIDKLELQLRKGQQWIERTQEQVNQVRVEQVEEVEENSQLRNNLKELLQKGKDSLLHQLLPGHYSVRNKRQVKSERSKGRKQKTHHSMDHQTMDLVPKYRDRSKSKGKNASRHNMIFFSQFI